MGIEEQCEREVAELHRFFQDWFNGDLPPAAFGRFEKALASDFVMITPDGGTHDRAAILAMVRAGHGRGGYRIEIRDHRHRGPLGAAVFVTYEEWQTTADGERGRVSTAIFRADPDGPNGVRWVHVHETWRAGG